MASQQQMSSSAKKTIPLRPMTPFNGQQQQWSNGAGLLPSPSTRNDDDKENWIQAGKQKNNNHESIEVNQDEIKLKFTTQNYAWVQIRYPLSIGEKFCKYLDPNDPEDWISIRHFLHESKMDLMTTLDAQIELLQEDLDERYGVS